VRRIGSGARVGAAAACLALLVAACGGSDGEPGSAGSGQEGAAIAEGRPGGVFRVPITEPKAIDPYNARESDGTHVTKRLFVGLVTYDGNAELKMRPGVAERWASNDDCTRWTFNLRRSKFSNGEDVDAQSFIRGWTRTAVGTAASQVAYHMAGVQGFGDLHADPPKTPVFSGLSAPDPQTLAVQLAEADCQFDVKTLVSAMSPVPSTAGAADNQTFNEAPVGNGPFMIKPGTKWEHNQGISLVRNDSYFGTKPNLDGVEFMIFAGQGGLEARYRAFTAGEVDFAPVPPTLFQQAEATYKPQGSFLKTERFGINYILVNTAKAPMNNADARKAVSMAIDRDAINKGVYQGSLTSATALVPPPAGDFHQPDACGEFCTYDPARAKELAVRGGLAPGARLKLSYNIDGGNEPLVQAWKDQLERNLGVVVELDGAPFGEQLEKWGRGDFDIARSAWGSDYPTADSFLYPLLHSGADDNLGKYENAEFDALLLKGRAQKNEADRVTTMKQAEKLAVGQDMAAIPTFYRTQYRVFNSKKWTGVGLDFFEHATVETISLRA
jgi:oligopeptide transport system substrate-binding protein